MTYPSSTAASAVSVEYIDSDIFDVVVPTVSLLSCRYCMLPAA